MEKTKNDRGLKSPKAWIKLLISVILSAIIIFSQSLGMTLASSLDIPPLFKTALGEAVPLVLAVLAMIVLGGIKWLGIDKESIRYAFKVGWVFPALGLVVSIMRTFDLIKDGTKLPSDALVNLAAVILACILIGAFEEVLYRGISFGSLLGVFGGSKLMIMFAVLFSSWAFGRVHVTSLSLADPMQFAQSILKIIQTGMMGIVMCDIMLHTRKIGSAALIHTLSDLMLMITGALFEGSSVSGQYTTSDSATGKMLIITYLLMIAIYLLPTVFSIRRIWKEHDECYGPFVK